MNNINLEKNGYNETLASRRKKDHIIKTASKLFLKNSYDRTSIRDISRASGMAMGTLYHYIDTKENLLRMVVEDGHGDTTRDILKKISEIEKNTTPVDTLVEALKFFIQGIEGSRELFVFVFTEAKVMPPHIRSAFLEKESMLANSFGEILAEGQKKGVFHIDNIPLTSHFIVSLVEMWGVKWWYLKNRCTPIEYRESLTDFILKSICSQQRFMAGQSSQ